MKGTGCAFSDWVWRLAIERNGLSHGSLACTVPRLQCGSQVLLL